MEKFENMMHLSFIIKSGGLSSLQNNIRIANGGNEPALKPAVNNPTAVAKAMYQSRRDAAGLPKENTLLDNIRVYNGKDRYNKVTLWTPIPTLMSTSGGSFTYAESVAAKEEAARCMGYEYVVVGYQGIIKGNEIKVVNGNYTYYIPSTFSEIILNKNTGDVTEEFHYPQKNWDLAGKGQYNNESALQENEAYLIAVGPKILNPNYSDEGRLLDTDFENIEGITLVLEDKENGNLVTVECMIKDTKAHTYNRYPDGHENDTLPYEAIAGIQNGLVQTGISYPESVNAKKDKAFAPENIDSSVIEFTGQSVNFEPSDYSLQTIVVKTK